MRSLWLPDMDWVGDRRAVNIAVVGDVCHGKTTLVASLVLAQHERLGVPLPALDYRDPILLALRGDYSPTTVGASIPTATARRVLNLIDCPAEPSNLTDAFRLIGMADGVVLVVSAEAGVSPLAQGLAHAASRAGVRHLIGFVNRQSEADPSSLWWKGGAPDYTTPEARADEVETGLRRLLLDAGFQGDDLTVVRGGTWKNLRVHRSAPPVWVDELLYAIETELPTPPRDYEAPLLMLASDSSNTYAMASASNPYYISGGHVAGVVRRGVLRVGDPVDVVGGQAGGREILVSEIWRGNQTSKEALPGDIVGVVLRILPEPVVPFFPCHALVEPGSLRAARKLVARLTVLTPEQGGRRRGMPSGMCPRFSMGTAAFRAPIVVDDPKGIVNPGQTGRVEIESSESGYVYGPKGIFCEPGQGFVCRDGGRVIAVGEVEAVER